MHATYSHIDMNMLKGETLTCFLTQYPESTRKYLFLCKKKHSLSFVTHSLLVLCTQFLPPEMIIFSAFKILPKNIDTFLKLEQAQTHLQYVMGGLRSQCMLYLSLAVVNISVQNSHSMKLAKLCVANLMRNPRKQISVKAYVLCSLPYSLSTTVISTFRQYFRAAGFSFLTDDI